MPFYICCAWATAWTGFATRLLSCTPSERGMTSNSTMSSTIPANSFLSTCGTCEWHETQLGDGVQLFVDRGEGDNRLEASMEWTGQCTPRWCLAKMLWKTHTHTQRHRDTKIDSKFRPCLFENPILPAEPSRCRVKMLAMYRPKKNQNLASNLCLPWPAF